MRKADWKACLTDYVAGLAQRPFEPGLNDCALFAAGAVAAMTGSDPAHGWRGRYRTLRGGLRLLRKQGYTDQIAYAASLLPEIPVAFAAPGDLAVVNSPAGPALGVVQGEGVYVLTPVGLGLLPLLSATRAFRVD
ncbi:DUF6950 family protein [Tabrizicola fusiformis]|uniref:DUF6950 family protein n=1 Tax=Tabrizicola sp. SY72 TaxID=2741673 RepID=UPI001574DC5F|nr:hypothetical protein [Tabrizicola sp. SY72]NTT86928.1 hypothetical protein [Tabrizicola sp. SY72]